MPQRDHLASSLFDAHPERRVPTQVLLAWTLGLFGFGFALGTYNGINGTLLATWKIPFAAALSIGITLPSLAVFSALTTGTLCWRRTTYLAGLTAAILGALMLALAPVMWLFASSSFHLGWPVVVAAGLATASLFVAGSRVATHFRVGKSGYLLWLLLLIPVALQMVTTIRPVITKNAPSGSSRMFFLEHFSEIADYRLPAASEN